MPSASEKLGPTAEPTRNPNSVDSRHHWPLSHHSHSQCISRLPIRTVSPQDRIAPWSRMTERTESLSRRPEHPVMAPLEILTCGIIRT